MEYFMNYKKQLLILLAVCAIPHMACPMNAPYYKAISSLFKQAPTIEDDVKSVTDLLNQGKFHDAIKIMYKYNVSDLKHFIPALTVRCVEISNVGLSGYQLLMKIIKAFPYDATPLVANLAKNAKKVSLETLVALADIKVLSQAIDDAIVSLVSTGDAADLFKGLSYAAYKNKKNLPFKLTPTGIHLYNNLWALNRYPIDKYKIEPGLLEILSQIIAKERELGAQGFYTFLHGQRRVYYLPERLYTMLWQARKNQAYKDFLFAHVKPLLQDEKEKTDEEAVRQYLLLHGRKPKDNYTRQKLLFLNYAHFAQIIDMGSNTAHYVAANTNWGSVPINIFPKDAFKLLGFEHIYEKYASQIDELQKEHENSGQFGNTLLVAIPKNKVHRYAFLCESGRGLSGRGGVRKAIYIKGIGMTDDIKVIMETLLNNPEKIQDTDDLEFCMIMTQKEGGLDPQTGIQVHPLISGDATRIAQLQQKEQKLLALIENDVKKNLAAESAHNRIMKLGGHLMPDSQQNQLTVIKAAGRIKNILNQLNV